MKSKKIIALGVSLVTIASNMLFFYPGDHSSSVSEEKKEVKEVRKSKKDRNQENQEITSTRKEIETSASLEEEQENSVSSDKKSVNVTQNETKGNKNNATSNYSNQQEQPKAQTPPPVSTPKVQTEWEKLGISEYDYYNSPGPNEGQIAFRGAESECERIATDITNTYGFVTHYGDVKSYSERYIGCWITVHLPNGNRMFYNEFKARESRGEF